MQEFEVLEGCEKSETGNHDFREECRYDGEKWYSPQVGPKLVERRAVCRLCEVTAEPVVISLQKTKQHLEWGRQSRKLGMMPEDYTQF